MHEVGSSWGSISLRLTGNRNRIRYAKRYYIIAILLACLSPNIHHCGYTIKIVLECFCSFSVKLWKDIFCNTDFRYGVAILPQLILDVPFGHL